MKTVHLARGLTLPAAELATEVTASLGMRGSGKSNGAAVIAEGLLEAGIQVIVLDHVGIWFSLRLAADGKRSSPFQIPVLGGDHGDIALVASTGKTVADALAQSGSSAVLDVSGFSKGDRCRFATDFAEAFFQAKKKHPGPVQILLEEAQRYIPQKLFSGQGLERMLGAFEEIAEVGRNYGVGLHLVSQRPQKLNKDVLNLADNVFSYRTNGVLERKAIREWVQEKGAEGRAEIDGELPGLPRGSAVVWSPVRRIYGRYAIELKSTYDAGATPTHARARVKTRRLDLAELESVMGAAVEEAKMNDPRILRQKIAEMEKLLAKGPTPKAEPKTREKIKTVQVFSESELKRIERLAEKLGKHESVFSTKIAEAVDRLAQAQQAIISEIGNLSTIAKRVVPPANVEVRPSPKRTPRDSADYFVSPRKTKPHVVPTINGESKPLSRAGTAILHVLAQRGHASDSQISALSGYRITSSSFANALSELRTQGLIDNGPPERRTITDKGRELAGDTEPLPTGRALLDYWLGRLSACEAKMLDVIYARNTVSRDELSERTGYSITSSSFANGISALRTLELVHGPKGGDLTIADVFLE